MEENDISKPIWILKEKISVSANEAAQKVHELQNKFKKTIFISKYDELDINKIYNIEVWHNFNLNKDVILLYD